MARGRDRTHDDDEEKEDKDAGVSDEALEDVLDDEDEEDDFGFGMESDDDKGWE